MKKNAWIIAIVAVLLIIAVNGCSNYNSLVTMSENVDESWAKVENQYQRRFDLIPNLVSTVQGYAKHEKSTLTEVTDARAGLSGAMSAAEQLKNSDLSQEESLNKYADAQQQLQKALNVYVNAVKEAYPDLKADSQFLDLQTQLEGTENRIANERREYTAQVKDYNVKVRRFPGNIWAGLFGFDAKPQFKADEAAQTAPKVSFE